MTNTQSGNPPDATAAAASRGPLSGAFGIVVFIVLFGTAGYLSYRSLTTAPVPVPDPIMVTFLCLETNKSFEYLMHEGEKWPVLSPFTNKKTGYPVEECYWTRDGKRKETPTFVVLNETLNKPGDTICPECGRLVVGHNPLPPESVPLETTTAPAKDAAESAPPTTQPAE